MIGSTNGHIADIATEAPYEGADSQSRSLKTNCIHEMLRTTIADCDTLIHLAGKVYGTEPQERKPDEQRHSYTQLEYEFAREAEIEALEEK